MKFYIIPFYLLLSLIFLACNTDVNEKDIAVDESEPGINLSYMDSLSKPKENFFAYANGSWLSTTKIPEDRARWGSFDELRQRTDEDVLAILASAMSNDKDLKSINILPGSDQEKVIKLYETIMDSTSRNERGIDPIMPIINKIENIENLSDLQQYLIYMEPKGQSGFFRFRVSADAKNSIENAAYLGVGSLGLPDRDYYVKDDEDSKKIRQKYVDHVSKMLQYLDKTEEDANREAKKILEFETLLAKPRMDKVDRRNPNKTYNPKSIEDLQKVLPAINWTEFFSGIGAKGIDTLIVSDPNYMVSLQAILNKKDVETWKSFLTWTTLNGAANMLTDEMDTTDWEFYSKELRGTKKQRARNERALQTVNRTVGEALGKLYVDEKFPPEAKKKAQEMIANVIKAFEIRISNLEWMSEETKAKAIEKLNATTIKIAYPDKWKDYGTLKIKGADEGGSFIENMMAATAWNFKDGLDKLYKPVDKSEWFMAPQIVNAYFNPRYNEIVFPAAILQPPFYNYQADDAVNYGGIGAVIGHEISHSFDDQGAKFDKDGNLKNWWTDGDKERFEELGKSLATQYDNLEVLPEVNVNGKFTLGENIGDLGGVNAAYDALQLSFKDNGKPGKIDGFTAEQRFFISWATIWRTKSTVAALNNQIKTDPHSPGMFRAMQPLKNIEAFYEAFDIKEGDSMYVAPEDRVLIW